MTDLKSRFEQAVEAAKALPEKPDNLSLLKMYGLYKQVREGDVESTRPGFTDLMGRAKWDAWKEAKGKTAEQAMQQYVDLIDSLR